MPEPVVVTLRTKAGNSSLQVFDSVSETPEFIWTAEMQGELRAAMTIFLGCEEKNISDRFRIPLDIPITYFVKYRQLENEMYIGGVYIRLYLKQPTFRLSNPVFFLEKLVEFWESSFEVQVPKDFAGKGKDAHSTALVLGKEDFLALITSCIVCVLKGEPSVLDHVIAWGFPQRLCDFLGRCMDTRQRGGPTTCVCRILSELVGRVDIIDSLACSNVDITSQLTRALDEGEILPVSHNNRPGAKSDGPATLPKDAAYYVELLKKIFQCTASRYLGYFVVSAMHCNLVPYLLDHVVAVSADALGDVRNPSALKIHTVDLIKAIVAADPDNGAVIQAMLDAHHAWDEFKSQSHDLFLTVSKCCMSN